MDSAISGNVLPFLIDASEGRGRESFKENVFVKMIEKGALSAFQKYLSYSSLKPTNKNDSSSQVEANPNSGFDKTTQRLREEDAKRKKENRFLSLFESMEEYLKSIAGSIKKDKETGKRKGILGSLLDFATENPIMTLIGASALSSFVAGTVTSVFGAISAFIKNLAKKIFLH